jgi:hypothetical protein
MEKRNEDIALLLGVGLVGAWLGNLPDSLPWPNILLALGLLLILGVFVQRIRADQPAEITVARGLSLLACEFPESGAHFTVTILKPLTRGLWVVCDKEISRASACAASGQELVALETHKSVFVWIEGTGTVRIDIEGKSPFRRVKVSKATAWNVRPFAKRQQQKASPEPPTASGQSPRS